MLKKPLKRRMVLNLNTFTCTFAGVLLVLMITFMVQTPMLCKCVTIDPPKVRDGVPMNGALRDDALMVGIWRDGRITFGPDLITPDELAPRIRRGVEAGAERRVYITADARTKYGSVVEVLNGVRDAGVFRVAFIVERKPVVRS